MAGFVQKFGGLYHLQINVGYNAGDDDDDGDDDDANKGGEKGANVIQLHLDKDRSLIRLVRGQACTQRHVPNFSLCIATRNCVDRTPIFWFVPTLRRL